MEWVKKKPQVPSSASERAAGRAGSPFLQGRWHTSRPGGWGPARSRRRPWWSCWCQPRLTRCLETGKRKKRTMILVNAAGCTGRCGAFVCARADIGGFLVSAWGQLCVCFRRWCYKLSRHDGSFLALTRWVTGIKMKRGETKRWCTIWTNVFTKSGKIAP